MDVHQDELRTPLLPGSDARLTIVRVLYRKPHGAEQFYQPVSVLHLVIDNQDLWSFAGGTDACDAPRRALLEGYFGVTPLKGNLEPEHRPLAEATGNVDVPAHQPRKLAGDRQA